MREMALKSSMALLALSLVVSCQSTGLKASIKNRDSGNGSSTQALTNETLMSLVKKFAASAQNDQAVFQELARYSRTDVIDQLLKLRKAFPQHAADRVSIGFLLCYLDHDVAQNKLAIAEAFTREPFTKNAHADWEAELLRRLINSGHRDLLPTLLVATERADGALSSSLSDFFCDQLRREPEDFIVQVSMQPERVRQAVYASIAYGEFSRDDQEKFRRYLNSTSDSHAKSVGQEILLAMRGK